MKKEQVKRNFILTDAVMKQKADEFIDLIDRDIAEFTDRVMTAKREQNSQPYATL